MIGGAALYGILVAIFSASPWFWVSMVLMIVIGLCHVASQALVQTVVQTYSPAEFRGRTMSIYNMTQVVFLLGGAVLGALSSLVGAARAAASMSIVGIMTMVAICVLIPESRKIR